MMMWEDHTTGKTDIHNVWTYANHEDIYNSSVNVPQIQESTLPILLSDEFSPWDFFWARCRPCCKRCSVCDMNVTSDKMKYLTYENEGKSRHLRHFFPLSKVILLTLHEEVEPWHYYGNFPGSVFHSHPSKIQPLPNFHLKGATRKLLQGFRARLWNGATLVCRSMKKPATFSPQMNKEA